MKPSWARVAVAVAGVVLLLLPSSLLMKAARLGVVPTIDPSMQDGWTAGTTANQFPVHPGAGHPTMRIGIGTAILAGVLLFAGLAAILAAVVRLRRASIIAASLTAISWVGPLVVASAYGRAVDLPSVGMSALFAIVLAALLLFAGRDVQPRETG